MYRRNLSVAWVDYKKAFDMVPHRWLNKVMKAINAPRPVRKTIRRLLPLWETDITVLSEQDRQVRIPIIFRRGLFQGDSLSPLLFCLVVAPISWELRKRKGFTTVHRPLPVTHLMFMDDLKIYEEDREGLSQAVGVVEQVTEIVGMKMGLRKCAVAHMKAGKVAIEGGIQLSTGEVIEEITGQGTYKYLGITQILLPEPEEL